MRAVLVLVLVGWLASSARAADGTSGALPDGAPPQAGALSGVDPDAVGREAGDQVNQAANDPALPSDLIGGSWISHLVRQPRKGSAAAAAQVAQDHRAQRDRWVEPVFDLIPDDLTVTNPNLHEERQLGLRASMSAVPRNDELHQEVPSWGIAIGPSVRFQPSPRDGAGSINRVEGE